MASKQTMISLTLEHPTNKTLFTILVPQALHSRCISDEDLLSSLYETVNNSHHLTPGEETTLGIQESLAVFSKLKLDYQAVTVQNSENKQVTKKDEKLEETSSSTSVDNNGDRTSWSHSQVLLLLKLRKEHDSLFRSSCVTQKQAWRRVSEEMVANDHNMTGEECGKKFLNLRSRHKLIKERNRKSGSNRNTWAYMEVMEQLFGSDPAVQPVTTVGSMAPPAAPQEENHAAPPKKKTKTDQREYLDRLTSMHEERMAIERRRVSALERLVELLESK